MGVFVFLFLYVLLFEVASSAEHKNFTTFSLMFVSFVVISFNMDNRNFTMRSSISGSVEKKCVDKILVHWKMSLFLRGKAYKFSKINSYYETRYSINYKKNRVLTLIKRSLNCRTLDAV